MKKIHLILSVWILLGSAQPSGFGQSKFVSQILVNPFSSSASLFACDLDRDGDTDFLAGSGVQGVYWFENTGEQPVRFVSQTVDAVLKKCFSVFAGDLDLDGNPDVIAGSWDDHDIAWYRRQENGTWTKTLIETNLTNVHELFICDIDLDGRQDILAAGAGADQVVWYRNSVSGSWIKDIVSNTFGGARSVAAADLDGDGDVDIAGAASDDHDITVWLNQGHSPAQWNKVTVADNFTGSHRIQIVDINLDGRPDLLGAAWGVNEVAWWENNGEVPSTWVKHTIDSSMPLALTALAMDFDRDGDIDISATGVGNQVAWYENQLGDCSQWRKKIIDAQLVGPWPLIAGDFDGDHDLDLIAGGDAGNQIRYYRNDRFGIFNGCMQLPSGKISIGLFLPEMPETATKPALLIALPGARDPRDYLMLRDALIPVSENRPCVILTLDFARAEAPDYEWSDNSLIGSALGFARERYSFDPEHAYVMGITSQGKPVLSAAQTADRQVRGFISFNPLIPIYKQDEWPQLVVPAVVAISETHADIAVIQSLFSHYAQDQPGLSLIKFDGPSSDYLTSEFPALTIQCLELIDAASTVGVENNLDDDKPRSLILNILAQNGQNWLTIRGETQGEVTVSLISLEGKLLANRLCQLNNQHGVLPLSDLFQNTREGIYLIRATDRCGRTAVQKVLVN